MPPKPASSVKSDCSGVKTRSAGSLGQGSGIKEGKAKGFSPERIADIRTIVEEMLTPIMENISDTQILISALRVRVDNAEAEVYNLKQRDIDRPAELNVASDIIRDVRDLRADVNRLLEPKPENGVETILTKISNRLQHLETAPLTAPTGELTPEIRDSAPNPAKDQGQQQHKPEHGDDNQQAGDRPECGDNDEEGQDEPDKMPDSGGKKREKRNKKKKRNNKRRSRNNGDDDPSSSSSSSSSSSESNSDSESESETSDEDEDNTDSGDERGGIFNRKRRPKYRDMKPIIPARREYRKILNYRYYRLAKRRVIKRDRDTRGLDKRISRLHTALSKRKFDATDKIGILYFLSQFVDKADKLGFTEGQALLALPEFLRGPVETRFNAAAGVASGREGIGSFPEAIQYLLLNYAKDSIIEDALLDLRDLTQRAGESEADFATRHSEAELRVGNVYTWEERKLRFINGLSPTIRALVTRYNRERRNSTYWDVVDAAQSEGDAYRARNRRADPILPNRPVRENRDLSNKRGVPRRVYLLEESESIPESRDNSGGSDGLFLVGEGSQSLPTSDTYTTAVETIDATSADYSGDPVLYAERNARTRVRPPRLAYADRNSALGRPGWIDKQARTAGITNQLNPQKRNIVCHGCYQPGHIIPDCLLDLNQHPDTVVRNYEALSRELLRTLPATSYWTTRDILDTRAKQTGSPELPPQPSEAHPRVLPSEQPPQDAGHGRRGQ